MDELAKVEHEGLKLTLHNYQERAAASDKLDSGFELPILGLFGEVGTLLSALKKRQRDAAAFEGYERAIEEELGDSLWYFSILAKRAGTQLATIAQRTTRTAKDWDEVVFNEQFGTFSDLQGKGRAERSNEELARCSVRLAGCVGDLIKDHQQRGFEENRDLLTGHLVEILRAVLATASAAGIDLGVAAAKNLEKINSRWPIEFSYPERIDSALSWNEQLPKRLCIFISEEESNGKLYVFQQSKGLIIGDRLTDNKTETDDYRFHDVFHIAFAVHLGWSPVMRSLLHLKRKSVPALDENEDGARANLIEEGLASFIFARGLMLNNFEGITSVDYDLLKFIQGFVKGYEVERCSLWQWERAILDAFSAFRALVKKRRGLIIADLDNHTMSFKEAEHGDVE
jgi:NTP pyrophosphatase (non-canonical NTP hydrolase)